MGWGWTSFWISEFEVQVSYTGRNAWQAVGLAEMNSEQRCGQEIYSRGMIVEIEGIKYHRLSRISSKIAPVTIHS